MNFSDKSRYDRIFQQFTHKGGESEMNYIKIFQNAQDLSVSLGNNYSEDQLMHIFMDNYHQGGKYSTQIASHQSELRREERFTNQKSLSILSLQPDYLNLDSSSGCGKNSTRANIVQKKCTFKIVANHFAEKNSKGSERKRKKIMRLVLRTTNVHNTRLANVLDADLKIA